MKISIITPVYNWARTIRQTIDSVLLDSDNVLLEYILVDACSTDGTTEIIWSYKDPRIIHICEKDKWLYDAMNKGVLRATGNIIWIINADDFYYPNTLKKVITFFEENQRTDIFHGNLCSISIKGDCIIEKPYPFQYLYYWMCIKHPTCFVRKKVYQNIWLFDINFTLAADYDFLLRCFIKKYTFGYLDDTIAGFRRGWLSDEKRFLSLREQFYVRKKNSCQFLRLTSLLVLLNWLFLNPFFRKVKLLRQKLRKA